MHSFTSESRGQLTRGGDIRKFARLSSGGGARDQSCQRTQIVGGAEAGEIRSWVDVRRAHGGMLRVLAGDIVTGPARPPQATGRRSGLVSSFRFAALAT